MARSYDQLERQLGSPTQWPNKSGKPNLMAIANSITIKTTHECFLRPTEHCFYCGNALIGDRWVYWNGLDEKEQQIWLHCACAKRLSDHLASDWHKSI